MLRLYTLTAAAVFMAATVAGQSSSITTTSVSVFQAGSTTIPVSGAAGSIVGVDAIATTIVVACYNSSDCGLSSETVTFTQGRSSFAVGLVFPTELEGTTATITATVDCDIVSTSAAASCHTTAVASVAVGGLTIKTTSTLSSTYSSNEIVYGQLLITAGVDKLTSPQATETPLSSSTSTGAAASFPTSNVGLNVGAIGVVAALAVVEML
ncbi:hypothetical protein F5884DRAFT_746164 [Xylogone sp. PMI_703]|nr:hypothetical protein F5884DRAFT_746164 [Xylogone sp. PMI_703]